MQAEKQYLDSVVINRQIKRNLQLTFKTAQSNYDFRHYKQKVNYENQNELLASGNNLN